MQDLLAVGVHAELKGHRMGRCSGYTLLAIVRIPAKCLDSAFWLWRPHHPLFGAGLGGLSESRSVQSVSPLPRPLRSLLYPFGCRHPPLMEEPIHICVALTVGCLCPLRPQVPLPDQSTYLWFCVVLSCT